MNYKFIYGTCNQEPEPSNWAKAENFTWSGGSEGPVSSLIEYGIESKCNVLDDATGVLRPKMHQGICRAAENRGGMGVIN